MLSPSLRVLYLHGFASSPASQKARFFAAQFQKLNIPVEIPDLAQGRFEHLTITGQLEFIESLVGRERVTLIGSSLGGYLAALYAARYSHVDRLVLLAPAFGLYQLWMERFGPEKLAQWKMQGSAPVFHYGLGREAPLSYDFMRDASRYEPFPDFVQPALIFHGNNDTSVPVAQSVAFAQGRPNVHLIRLDSGHELTDVLEVMWRECERFVKDEDRRQKVIGSPDLG